VGIVRAPQAKGEVNMLSSIGMGELLLIIVIALFVVGPDRLPKLAKDIGRTFAKFKKSINAMTDELQDTQEGLGTLANELNKVKSELGTTVTDAIPPERTAGEDQPKEVATEDYGQDRHH
jgi:Tat protein translocase TatB subunit